MRTIIEDTEIYRCSICYRHAHYGPATRKTYCRKHGAVTGIYGVERRRLVLRFKPWRYETRRVQRIVEVEKGKAQGSTAPLPA